jgi:hypothetical protein
MVTKTRLRKIRQRFRGAANAQLIVMSEADLRNMAAELGKECNELARQKTEVALRLTFVQNELARRKAQTASGMFISDHAVLRYLERVKGVDMMALRLEIEAIARAADPVGSSRNYTRLHNEERGIILGIDHKSDTVTTVMTPQENGLMDAPQ